MGARRSHSEWSSFVELFERSGMTHEQFCNKHGLKVKSFRGWLYRLRDAGSRERVELLPVKLVPHVAEGTRAEETVPLASVPRDVVVKMRTLSIHVTVGTDIGYVAALLKAMEGRC